MPSTFSPDPATLGTGAGTAAAQAARPPQRADHVNGGYDSKATGATAGAPGTWSPAGSAAPYTVADCQGVVATPNTAWTTGQHVLLADGVTHVHYGGVVNGWQPGDGTGAERAAKTKGGDES